MTKWTKENIEKEYKNGRRYFCGEDFSDLDLAGANLTKADLTKADLTGANLTVANLSMAILTNADMRGAHLSGANLVGANLVGADISKVDLTGANLSWADMTDADMRGADMRGVYLDYSCLPLWCGSLNVKVDKRIAVQLMYHACALDCDDPEYQELRQKCIAFANKMHRTDVRRLE